MYNDKTQHRNLPKPSPDTLESQSVNTASSFVASYVILKLNRVFSTFVFYFCFFKGI